LPGYEIEEVCGAPGRGGRAKGANAIIALRFDTSELGSTRTEICAYGTAVTAKERRP
jgi:uncharacterized protein YbjQ (UPF0145 family)